MSCSSNRNRLVGSCISTLVSRTKSFEDCEGPMRAGLREGRRWSFDGTGRSLRSTMGLLEESRRVLAPPRVNVGAKPRAYKVSYRTRGSFQPVVVESAHDPA